MKSFVGEQNYFEFDSLGNWKPVEFNKIGVMWSYLREPVISRAAHSVLTEAFNVSLDNYLDVNDQNGFSCPI